MQPNTPGQAESGPEIHDVMIDKANISHEDIAKSMGFVEGSSMPEMQWVHDLSPEEYDQHCKKLVRKIDTRLLPPLFVMIILNYMDRAGLAASKVQGIVKDLNLKGSEFNTAVSILYVGYILGQIPSNLMLSRVRPSIYLPTWVALWGIVSACTAAADNYAHLVTIRFLLGVTESPYFPGSIFFLSSWYTKKELAFRTAIFYAGSLLAQAFSGLVAAGVQSGLDGARGLSSWRWLFIIEGSLTVAVALAAMVILPDYPGNTRWLSDQEKAIAVHRLAVDNAGIEDEEKVPLLRAWINAMKDYKLWILSFISITKTTASGVTQFVPTVVATFGGSKVHSLLLTAPPYVVTAILSLIISWSSDRRKERGYHNLTPYIFGLIGFIIAAATQNSAARYFAIYMMIGGIFTPYNVLLAWISTCFPRPRSKRAAAIAFVNTWTNLANVWSPYFYKSSYSPQYTLAWVANSVMAALAIGGCLALKFLIKGENAALDRKAEEERQRTGQEVDQSKQIRFMT